MAMGSSPEPPTTELDPRITRLCKRCASIDLTPMFGYSFGDSEGEFVKSKPKDHQASFEDLVKAAEQGCAMCTAVAPATKEHKKRFSATVYEINYMKEKQTESGEGRSASSSVKFGDSFSFGILGSHEDDVNATFEIYVKKG